MRHPAAESGSSPFNWWLILPLLLVTILNPLNSSMLSTALMPIGQAFPGQDKAGGWLVASLYLTAAVSQPVLGSFADRFGARRTLVGATIVLAIGGLVGMLAQDLLTLIVSRILIGVGTSGAYPCAVAIIRHRANDAGIEPPARILGFLAAASAVAVGIGPPLGGLVTEWLGWRGVFAINLPLAVIAFVLIYAAVPVRHPSKHGRGRVDWIGIALFSVFMTAFMFFLMHLESGLDMVALILALVGGALFVLAEKRQTRPFIDLGLLRANRALTLTYGNHVAFNFVNYCYFYAMPQWSQTTLDIPLATSGLLLMPVAIASFVGALLPTRKRIGCIVELAGAASLFLACAALLFADAGTSIPMILALSFGFGFGFGVLNMSNQQRLLDYAPLEQSGSAAGLLRTAGYLGAMLSAPLVSYLMIRNAGHGSLATFTVAALPIALIPIVTVIADIRRGRHLLSRTVAAAAPMER